VAARIGLSAPVFQRAGAVHFTLVCVGGGGIDDAVLVIADGVGVWLGVTSLGGAAQAAPSNPIANSTVENGLEYFTQ
jgi:hypothetical protein